MDKQLKASLKRERQRQEDQLELVASENFTSPAVLAAQGSVLTNKYAEGYPGARHYVGCEYCDEVEELAQKYAQELFDVKYANVQPYGGAEANMIVFNSLLDPGDKILCMSDQDGGHVSHGGAGSAAAKYFEIESYGIDLETERLDYEAVRDQALEFKPDMLVAGASAYPRKIDFKIFKDIADEVDALFLVDMAHIAGLVASGLHPNPCPYADVVTTTTHKTLRGPRGGMILTNDKEVYEKINAGLFPGLQGGPLMHVVAGKAQAFYEDLQPEFKKYSKKVIENAQAMADEFEKAGFHTATGGTDNHLVLVQVSQEGTNGEEAEQLLESLNISCNGAGLVQDKASDPASGIRVGSPAMTTRGFDEEDFRQTARLVIKAIKGRDDPKVKEEVMAEVADLMEDHPLDYGEF